jgi:nitroimidazol reductase NimA-like FMN-containing flavoprotein (pyridoxamine 5'-phosphate oxidase superfamily)
MTRAPRFLILTSEDCRAVLDRNHVGRLAFINQATIDIEPIGYVARDKWVFFRSAYGSKLEALAHNPFVAFEVDEVAGPFDWRSVVVHGTIYMLPADGAPIERRVFERAVAALRSVMPETLTPGDPTPARDTVYGLHVDRVSGRMAQPASAKPGGRRAQPVGKSPKRRSTTNGF